MTKPANLLDENAAAAHGLAISAASSALARLLVIAGHNRGCLDQSGMYRMAEQAEKAATCLAIAGKAETAGDEELAALSWKHALSAMDRLSQLAGAGDAAIPGTAQHGMPGAAAL